MLPTGDRSRLSCEDVRDHLGISSQEVEDVFPAPGYDAGHCSVLDPERRDVHLGSLAASSIGDDFSFT